jgi:putative membrane protein
MRPWDAGLQPERTELAWRRTVLAVTAGTVVAARYLGAGDTVLGLALPALALVGGALLLHAGTVRFRRLDAALRARHAADGPERPDGGADEGRTPVMPGAGMLGALALMGVVIGVASAVFVVVAATSRGV